MHPTDLANLDAQPPSDYDPGLDPEANAASASPAPHAYAALTPDVVLDALSSVGLWGDGRLNPLSSYENRVYQVWLEDGSKVVTKFYRPSRWSDAQIAEEHEFSLQLADAEVPAVAPLLLNGASVHHHAGFSFSVSPWRGGRQPDLDDWDVLEWIGRFLARIHTVGAAQSFVQRPSISVHDFGQEPHDWLMQRNAIPPAQRAAWSDACQRAIGQFGLDLRLAQLHFAARGTGRALDRIAGGDRGLLQVGTGFAQVGLDRSGVVAHPGILVGNKWSGGVSAGTKHV